MAKWIDLLDPSADEVRANAPSVVDDEACAILLRPLVHDDEPRPRIDGRGAFVLSIFVVPVVVESEDRLYFQELDMVVTRDVVLTVRKTPARGVAFEPDVPPEGRPGELAVAVVDSVAEAFLAAVDALDDEVDEVDDAVDGADPAHVRQRIRSLRQDLLRVRRTISPTREALHRVVDRRVDVEGEEAFPHDVEVAFGDAYDKLLRAVDGLDLARDLLAGARDYLQSRIANEQNEVMKRLTAIASILLLPTFIVGLYGQNFQHHFPEIHWQYGYLWSWALIVATTAGQLVFFRRRGWI